MSIIVFLGPSLPIAEAREIIDARFCPPAQTGDVYRAALDKPKAIAIIDGLFEAVPAVWHKEVLFAMFKGINVYGASSMGALRAAELHSFGMKGVGRVFESFASGELEDDDEVAVVHTGASEGYRPLSEAMVNIREGLLHARSNGVISHTTHDLLVNIAKSQFYPERTWPTLKKKAIQAGAPKQEIYDLLDLIRAEPSNLKREDAIEVLELIKKDMAKGLTSFFPEFRLECSTFWEKLTDTMSTVSPGTIDGDISNEVIAQHAVLARAGGRSIVRNALLQLLVTVEAKRMGLEAREEEVLERINFFFREHGLITSDQIVAWLKCNALTEETFKELMKIDVLRAHILDRHRHRLSSFIVKELQLLGCLNETIDEVRNKHQTLAKLGIPNPGPEDLGTSFDEIIKWYTKRYGLIGKSLQVHACELGFKSATELLNSLSQLYAHEHYSDE